MFKLVFGEFEPFGAVLFHKFNKKPWFAKIALYVKTRYESLENRMVESFRYVECDPSNRNAFSYEYGSILRDAGSVFSSTMDTFVRKTKRYSKKKKLNIGDYRRWLKKEVPPIHLVVACLNYPREDRILLPFYGFESGKGTIDWWEAYTNVKHFDVEKFKYGSFKNALNFVAVVAALYRLVEFLPPEHPRLFENLIFHKDMEKVKKSLFFK